MSEWVSEWLLFSANSANLQLFHGENKLIFNDNEVRFVLDQHLSWIFIVLADRNNNLQIEMLLHSDTLSWFRVNQSLLCSFSLILRA